MDLPNLRVSVDGRQVYLTDPGDRVLLMLAPQATWPLALGRQEFAEELARRANDCPAAERVAAERVGGDPALRELLLREFGATDPELLADIIAQWRERLVAVKGA
jgi:hypothetical protein